MAWYHRRICLDNLKEIEYKDELLWLDSITVENQKNYQIWHHRKTLVEKLNDPSHEKEILNEVFEEEPKNFHAWCHRIWVVRRFSLFDGELDYIEDKLKEDIRNNSVWNYRFFIINNSILTITDEIINSEINYALYKIKQVPFNESPYSYIRGLLKPISNILKYSEIKSTIEEIIKEFPECYHAISLLLDWYIQIKDYKVSENLIDDLCKIDYIRRKYWLWRKKEFVNLV